MFPFVPKLVLISPWSNIIDVASVIMDSITTSYVRRQVPRLDNTYTDIYTKKSSDGKTLSWYNSYNATGMDQYQLNGRGIRYRWITLG